MNGPDRPILPESRREAWRWLATVAEDIDVAKAAARLPRLGASAFHLQQAAEKLLKALLILAGEPFRRTHDLDYLVDRLVPLYPQFAPDPLDTVRHLGIWSVAYRYPGLEDFQEPPPSSEEIDQYIGLLTAFAAEVGNLIGTAG
jgi:HEPN domain-containing protein